MITKVRHLQKQLDSKRVASVYKTNTIKHIKGLSARSESNLKPRHEDAAQPRIKPSQEEKKVAARSVSPCPHFRSKFACYSMSTCAHDPQVDMLSTKRCVQRTCHCTLGGEILLGCLAGKGPANPAAVGRTLEELSQPNLSLQSISFAKFPFFLLNFRPLQMSFADSCQYK